MSNFASEYDRGYYDGYVAGEKDGAAACVIAAEGSEEMAAIRLLVRFAANAGLVEAAADEVHKAYLNTCAQLGWEVKPANAVPYDELSETSKELDRASVRATLGALVEWLRAWSVP